MRTVGVDTPPAEPGVPGPAAHVRGWTLWTLRVIVLAEAALVLVQPVLAGLFVNGDVGMLAIHSAVAGFITVLAFFQLVAAILLWRPGRGAIWPIWAGLAFFVVAELQSGFGYARFVSAHIPLGVLLFGLAVAMLIGTWSPKLRVRRSQPRQRGAGS